MRYLFVIPALCLFGTVSLDADQNKLGDILKRSGDKKVLPKSKEKKKASKKTSRFVFKDEYSANGIGHIDKTSTQGKSESYNYENRSRFKFKFNDGYQQSNLVNRYGAGSVGGSMGSGGHGSGSGGGGKGRR